MIKTCPICLKEFSNTLKNDINIITKKRKSNQLKYLYNISIEEYESILSAQNGKCCICGKMPPNSNKKYLGVDHDHTTMKVRGLLCTKCNVDMAWFEKYRDKVLNYLNIRVTI